MVQADLSIIISEIESSNCQLRKWLFVTIWRFNRGTPKVAKVGTTRLPKVKLDSQLQPLAAFRVKF
jgi:hypothetical protein